jgi:ADP-ribose pyrophosphatase
MEALPLEHVDSIIAPECTQSPTPPRAAFAHGTPRRIGMARTLVFQGRKIQVAIDEEVRPDGVLVRRDVILHPGAVAILPLLDADSVCLLRNHRFVVNETLWEVPAGTLEPGEPIESAAERELAEETGYRASRWTRLGAFYPSPGVLGETTHLFIAQDLQPGAMAPEPGEELEPHVIPWAQALAWALDGTIRDAKTLIAILLWQQRRG